MGESEPSGSIFGRLLRGQATSAEYTAAVKRETRELLERRGWAPRVPPPPDPQTVETFQALEAERDRYREAAEVFARYYYAICDQLEGTDLAYLRARGTLNERYLRARETVTAFDERTASSAAPLNQPGPAEPDDRKGP
jgi:hypothetical protein